MNMDKIAQERIDELEAREVELVTLLDLAEAQIEEKDERIRVLEQAILEMKTVRYTDVA